MELFEKTGKIALGSRLRYMASNITEEAAGYTSFIRLNLHPNGFPYSLFYLKVIPRQLLI